MVMEWNMKRERMARVCFNSFWQVGIYVNLSRSLYIKSSECISGHGQTNKTVITWFEADYEEKSHFEKIPATVLLIHRVRVIIHRWNLCTEIIISYKYPVVGPYSSTASTVM